MSTAALSLPSELEREIFEWTACICSHDEIPTIMQVAKRVHEWLSPLLYRAIIIRGESPSTYAEMLILIAEQLGGFFPSLAPLLLHTPNLQVLDFRATSFRCIIPADTFQIAFTRPLRYFAPNPAWASELRVYNFGATDTTFMASQTLTHFHLSLSPKLDAQSLQTLAQFENLETLVVTPAGRLDWTDFFIHYSHVAKQVFPFLVNLEIVHPIMLRGKDASLVLISMVSDGLLSMSDYGKFDDNEDWWDIYADYETLDSVYKVRLQGISTE
ncbi:hypothetical protein DL96DRAFT_1716318 [Flagelloscypha sp. PMI_526]|nr:hypothetical protein DL96DRAFT_1716318 [Flagelloscypha sp. PMI_526]